MGEIKYAKIENENTKTVSVGVGTDTDFYKSIGMEELEVEQSYDGGWYLAGYAPQPSIEWLNNEVKMKRQSDFVKEADPIKLNLDEQNAIYENMVSEGTHTEAELEAQKNIVDKIREEWIEKKNEIRLRYPFIEEI
jgi:hypothetical protein